MAFVFVTSGCVNCGNVFSYHPNLVPSVRKNGIREPICKTCVEKANPIRVANGLAAITYEPGAYEPADENEVNWSDHG